MSAQLNYYQILGLTPMASKQQICQAYKALALKYHPSLKHQNQNKAYKTFCLISEAFDVLYDDLKRKVYDELGQQKLKERVVNENGEKTMGDYTFTTEPEIIFQKFFGSKNVYEHLLSVGSGEGRSHPIFSSQYGQTGTVESKAVPELVVPVQCTLSELFNGCKKTLTYKKDILSKDGQQTVQATQTKTIQLPAGACASNPLIFQKQGNQYPGQTPSNLVFKIIQIPEMNFQRPETNYDNLIYTANISLMDALDAKSIQVKQLSGQIIQLHFDQIISPQTERIIAGKGMPRDGIDGRGDLIVRFNIEFPEFIEIEKKDRIIELLKNAA